MKKSEAYYWAQIAVINSQFCPDRKIEVLRVLIENEDVAKFSESRESEEKVVGEE